MKNLLIVLVILASPHVAEARIGESLEMMQKRYAKTVMEMEKKSLPGFAGSNTYGAVKGNWFIVFAITNNRVVRIDYMKRVQGKKEFAVLTQAEALALLSKNSNGIKWGDPESLKNGGLCWATKCKRYGAVYEEGQRGFYVVDTLGMAENEVNQAFDSTDGL